MAAKKEYTVGQKYITLEYKTEGTYTRKIVNLTDSSFIGMVRALGNFDMRSASGVADEENMNYDQVFGHTFRLYGELLKIKDEVYGPNASLSITPQQLEKLRQREARRNRRYIRTQHGTVIASRKK
jgi:hypothetical protein